MTNLHPVEISGIYKLAFSLLSDNDNETVKTFLLLQEAVRCLKSSNMIPSDLVTGDKRLHKVINMTMSDHEGEAINGARETIRLIKDRSDVWKHAVSFDTEMHLLSRCHVNKGSCPLLQRLINPLHDIAKAQTVTNVGGFLSLSLGACHRSLPCINCRSAESFFKSMASIRLGKVERTILKMLLDQNCIKATSVTFGSRSQKESWYRSVKKLTECKLITKQNGDLYRTVMGSKVIYSCRHELIDDLPIRWEAKINALIHENVKPERTLLKDLHSDLLKRFSTMTYKDQQFDYIKIALNALDWVLR